MYKSGQISNKTKAFTIVELLVVIVVIGVLAAITIVSYSGMANKAIVANLQSDLNANSKLLKLYNVEYGYYPTTLNSENCPSAPTVDTRYCLRLSSGMNVVYMVDGQTFKLKEEKASVAYYITENSAPTPVGLPIVANNSSSDIASTTATLGTTVVADGYYPLTDAGICWGATANPTTNCQSSMGSFGQLTSIGTLTGTATQYDWAFSSDGLYLYATATLGNNVYVFSRDPSTGILTLSGSTAVGPAGTYVRGIAISPDGSSVYVTNFNLSNTQYAVYMYSRNATSGALTAMTTPSVLTELQPKGVVVSPDGSSAYVINSSSNTLSMYSRNVSSGILTPLLTPTITTESSPRNISISPDGKTVYVSNTSSNTISMYSRNTSDGMLTKLEPQTIATGAAPTNIAISSDGKYAYVAHNSCSYVYIYSRDISSGILTLLSTFSSLRPNHVVISPDGLSIYTQNWSSQQMSMYSRNALTGAAATLTPSSISFSAIVSNAYSGYFSAISPDGKSVYVSDSNAGTMLMLARNTNRVAIGLPFYQSRISLLSGTTVHFRGYATNSAGTSYSQDSTFVTP